MALEHCSEGSSSGNLPHPHLLRNPVIKTLLTSVEPDSAQHPALLDEMMQIIRRVAVARRRDGPLERQYEIEDLVQETLLSLISSKQENVESVSNRDQLKAFLGSVTGNVCASLLSLETRQKRNFNRAESLRFQHENQSLAFGELSLWEVLPDDTTAEELTIYRMKMEGYTVKEIVEAVEKPQRTVERILANLRRIVREAMDPELR